MNLLHATDVLLALVLFALAVSLVRERRALRRFVGGFGALPDEPLERVRRVAGLLYTRPRTPDDPPWLHPVLQPLGATPTDLIAHGGTCSGAARLLILSLAELGIRAHQVALYHREGRGQHSLVEVDLRSGAVVVDPTYGFTYADGGGQAVGLADLQRGVQPVFRPVPYSTLSSYPDHPYYQFDYASSKTANWTMSAPRRLAYRWLRRVMSRGADRIHIPALLEWPQVQLMLAVALLAAALHGAAALLALLRAAW